MQLCLKGCILNCPSFAPKECLQPHICHAAAGFHPGHLNFLRNNPLHRTDFLASVRQPFAAYLTGEIKIGTAVHDVTFIIPPKKGLNSHASQPHRICPHTSKGEETTQQNKSPKPSRSQTDLIVISNALGVEMAALVFCVLQLSPA